MAWSFDPSQGIHLVRRDRHNCMAVQVRNDHTIPTHPSCAFAKYGRNQGYDPHDTHQNSLASSGSVVSTIQNHLLPSHPSYRLGNPSFDH